MRTRTATHEAILALPPLLFFALFLLSSLPLIGKTLLRLAAHPGYRAHITAILTRPEYRRAWFRATRAGDVREWCALQRIPGEHARYLAHAPIGFLVEKATCSWLPAATHRLLTDPAARRKFLADNLIYPIRLLISQPDRMAWLEGIIQSEQGRGLIGSRRAATLLNQIREAHLQGFARDLGFTAGLDVISRLVYLLLAIYGGATGDFWPLGLAALGPIPPSGPLRLLYVLGQIASDMLRLIFSRTLPNPSHLLLARLGALLVCPWRGVGNLFPVFEISAYYPCLALLLAEHYASRAVRNVPIFGGQGKLLEYGIFQLFYNLPVGIKMLLKGEG